MLISQSSLKAGATAAAGNAAAVSARGPRAAESLWMQRYTLVKMSIGMRRNLTFVASHLNNLLSIGVNHKACLSKAIAIHAD